MHEPSIASLPQAELTDEMIEQMRAKVGIELRIDHSIYNERATRIAILRFCEGIGDPNPLWTDPDYAARSRFGGLVAPPSFVIGCFSGIQFGWPGLGSFHSSTDCEFIRPVRLDDTVSATCVYEGFEGPKPSTFAGQMIEDHFLNTYVNQDGNTVARIRWRVVNYERKKAVARTSTRDAGNAQTPEWDIESLEAVEEAVLSQTPQGATPRFFEEVAPGDQVQSLTKGPLSMTDEIAFISGGGAPIPRLAANKAALAQYRRHPSWSFRDPTTMALEPVYAVHYNQSAALAMGVPKQYDVGFQRQCWQIQLITNWIGDDATIVSTSAQYRKFVFLGDVIRLGGEVEETFVTDRGEGCVRLRTWALNQRQEDVMPGSALVVLPRKESEGEVTS